MRAGAAGRAASARASLPGRPAAPRGVSAPGGRRVPAGACGCLRRRVFLARVPRARLAAKSQRRVVARQDRPESSPGRPDGGAPARGGVGRPAVLGAPRRGPCRGCRCHRRPGASRDVSSEAPQAGSLHRTGTSAGGRCTGADPGGPVTASGATAVAGPEAACDNAPRQQRPRRGAARVSGVSLANPRGGAVRSLRRRPGDPPPGARCRPQERQG